MSQNLGSGIGRAANGGAVSRGYDGRVARGGAARRHAFVAPLTALLAALTSVGLFALVPSTAAADPLPPLPQTASVDPLPTVQINGVVWDQEVVGNTVYVAGSFTQARPAGAAPGTNETPRANMLAYDIRTGVMDPTFNPVFNAEVQDLAITPDGTKLVAVGPFTSVNGDTRRQRVAIFNLPSGTLSTTAVPNLNGTANSVAVTNSTVYVGGYFGTANGVVRQRLAALRITNGATLPFAAPVDNRQVQSIVVAPDEKSVVISGNFTSIGGQSTPGYGLARLDGVTGSMLPLPVNMEVRNAGDNSGITRLKTDGERFYGAGWHYGRGGNVEGFFAANWSDGSLAWIQDCHGDTYDIAPLNDVTYTASHAHYCGNSGGFPQTSPGTNRHAGAWTNDVVRGTNKADIYDYPDHAGTPRPEILNFFPVTVAGTYTAAAQAVWNVAGTDDYVLYGGEFTKVSSQAQQGLVRFAKRSIAPNKRGPRLASTDWAPSVESLEPGSVRVEWQPNFDEDDSKLTYTVYRDSMSNPVYQTTQDALFWRAKTMHFDDTNLDPSTPVQYRVRATDPWGNIASSDWVTVTPSGGTTLDTYSRTVLQDDPVKYWRLNEASGSAVNDLAGSDNTTLTGNYTRQVAGALSNSADSATQFTSNSARAISKQLVAGPQQFSVEAWFKTSSNAGGKIAGFGSSSSGTSGTYDRDLYLDSSRRVSFSIRNRSSRIVLRTPGAYNDNQWHHATGVLSPDEMTLYVDGKLVSTRSDLSMAREYNGYWRVGGDGTASGSQYFVGSIDDFAVYDSALTADQVRSHWVASGRNAPTANQAPVADFTVTTDGRTARFDASASSDPDGSISSYSWDFGDGASGSGAAPTRTYSGASTYWATLTVTDNNGVTTSVRKPVVTTTNRSPQPTFSSSVSGLTASFDSAGTTDPDGSVTSLQWSYGDGTFGSGTTSSHTYDQGGTYDVTLTATDNLGAVSWTTKKVTVQQAPNQAPTAAFTATPSGATVAFDASGSSDPDGSVTSYAWDFGDGSGGTGASTDHTYTASGSYQVKLTVTDNRGGTNSLTKSVSVTLPNQKPTARFSSSTSQLKADFDATASSDPDGTVASYSWNFGDQSSGTGASPSHTYASSGTYQVTLTVTDDKGATDSVTHAVSVFNALAADSFERTVTGGWGTADAGGPWTVTGGASRFSVSGGAGRMQVPSGASSITDLASVSSSDDQLSTVFSVDKVAEGTYVELRGRKIGDSYYAGRIRISADGTAQLYLIRDTTGVGPSLVLPFKVTPGTRYNFVLAVSGTSPTTLSAKAWPVGGQEPGDWQLSRTDTFAGLQAKGAIGLRGYLPGSSSAASPVTVAFHDLDVVGVGAAVPVNAKPTAAFSATPNALSVAFDGSGSSDSDGTVASYAWDFGDQSSGTGASPSHTYGSSGTYQVTLTVTDDKGATGSLTKPVTVSAGNQKPTARFTASSNQLVAAFDGSTSSDSDGTVASYSWDFGDQSSGTGASPSHPYASSGTYQVTLTVTDDKGATDSVTHAVTVLDALAADAFERNLASGWGSADTGGAWTLTGPAARFSVSGGAGRMEVPSGASTITDLGSVSSSDDEMSVVFSVDKVAEGTYVELRGRKIGDTYYGSRIRIAADGSARLHLLQTANGVGPAFDLPFTITPNAKYNLVVKVSGTSPTTLSAKAWPVGGQEPSDWQLTRTDTFAALQAKGAVGLRGYLPGSSSAASPVTISFHDLVVRGIQG